MSQRADVHIAVVSQNADLATDMRPRAMASALAAAGFLVSLVGPTDSATTDVPLVHPNVALFPFALPKPAASAVGQVREQVQATLRALRVLKELARRSPVHVVHVGNPPDNGWIFPLALRMAQGFAPAFVYDQHDPAPLLVADKFGAGRSMSLVASVLARFEAACFRRADLTVLANDAFLGRAHALGLVESPAIVAMNGWSLPTSESTWSLPWRNAALPLVTYIGSTNVQDCIAHLVRALSLVKAPFQAVVVGDGDARSDGEALATQLGIAHRIVWLGWIRDRDLISYLVSDAAVCVAPETPSPANDLSTFVKVLEYMSLGAPVVAHRLPQTELVAADTIEYADDFTPRALAVTLERFLLDPTCGIMKARAAKRRFDESLRWEAVGSQRLVAAYERDVLPVVMGKLAGVASGASGGRLGMSADG